MWCPLKLSTDMLSAPVPDCEDKKTLSPLAQPAGDGYTCMLKTTRRRHNAEWLDCCHILKWCILLFKQAR